MTSYLMHIETPSGPVTHCVCGIDESAAALVLAGLGGRKVVSVRMWKGGERG